MNKNNNIYESIYHLKKMFPKFELDIIESILRGNCGNIETTLDQLLAISVIDDVDKNKVDTQSLYVTTNDLPPSYNDIIPKFQQQPHNSFQETSIIKNSEKIVKKDERILNKLNSVLVGELPRDFLRIKLNSQQLKLVKKTDERYKNKKPKVRISSRKIHSIQFYSKIESTIIKNSQKFE